MSKTDVRQKYVVVVEEEKWMGIRPTRPKKFYSWRECLVILSDPGAAALDKTVGMYVVWSRRWFVVVRSPLSLSLSRMKTDGDGRTKRMRHICRRLRPNKQVYIN